MIYEQQVNYVAVPLGNHTKHHIISPRKSSVGSIQPIKAVVEADWPGKRDVKVEAVTTSPLNEEQQETVNKLLLEESSASARDVNDVGRAPSPQMSMNLKDDIHLERSQGLCSSHMRV